MLQVRRSTRQRAEAIRLSSVDVQAALGVLHSLGDASETVTAFAQLGVTGLQRLASSDLVTLSICNLDSGHRSVVSNLPGAISKRELEVFDRYFFQHPLVREHGRNPGAVTRRINDLLSPG